jgi:hypothetical protein
MSKYRLSQLKLASEREENQSFSIMSNEFKCWAWEDRVYYLLTSSIVLTVIVFASFLTGFWSGLLVKFMFGFNVNFGRDFESIISLIKIAVRWMSILFVIFFCLSLCTQAFKKINKVGGEWWFKYLIAFISLIISLITYSLSGLQTVYYINDITGIDASYFPAANYSLNAFFFIPIWLLGVAILSQIYILIVYLLFCLRENKTGKAIRTRDKKSDGFVSQFKQFVSQFKQFVSSIVALDIYSVNKERKSFYIFISKAFGAAVIYSICFSGFNLFVKEGVVLSFAKDILIDSEFFPKSNCIDLKLNEKIAALERGFAVVYNPNEVIQFRTVKCDFSK